MIEDKEIPSDPTEEQILAKIFTFGSYRLGVTTPGSDIDCICVVVKPIERSQHFFGTFFQILKRDENAENLIKIEHAWVPVIKMVFHGVQIDLTFC